MSNGNGTPDKSPSDGSGRVPRQQFSQAVSQELKTPVIEHGVSIRGSRVGQTRISRRIQRVWATLWGWTGYDLRMVAVNKRGSVRTAPHVWDITDTVAYGSLIISADPTTSDFGVVFDHFSGFIYGAPVYLDFSLDGVTYGNRRGFDAYYNANVAYTFLGTVDIWVRARYVKAYRISAGGLPATTTMHYSLERAGNE